MDLLVFHEIQKQLDEKFLPLEPTITGMRLVPKIAAESQIQQCQNDLRGEFPAAFRNVVSRFDFGNFALGPVTFCYQGEYFQWLADHNDEKLPRHLAWWSAETRPTGLMLVADSDPYAIVLHTLKGQVSAFVHGETVPLGLFVIASDFDLFVRGLATAMLNRVPNGENERLAQLIAAAVGVDQNNPFWKWLAA